MRKNLFSLLKNTYKPLRKKAQSRVKNKCFKYLCKCLVVKCLRRCISKGA